MGTTRLEACHWPIRADCVVLAGVTLILLPRRERIRHAEMQMYIVPLENP